MRWAIAAGVTMAASIASAAGAQAPADPPPEGAFQTLHLLRATPAEAADLAAAVPDFNAEFAKGGCTACRYRLLSRFNGASPYPYVLVGEWPSGRDYTRIHASAAFGALYARHPAFAAVEARQDYGRYVEGR